MKTGDSLTGDKNSHFHRYLEFAAILLSGYKGRTPFHSYLKKYFAANKKHGSRDRKLIASLCYQYFRVVSGMRDDLSWEDKLLLALFLVEKEKGPLTGLLSPDRENNISAGFEAKAQRVGEIFSAENLFPFSDELSQEIDTRQYCQSFLSQPDVFIRIRPGYRDTVLHKLEAAGIHGKQVSGSCLSLANGEKIDGVIRLGREAVVQDYNSQRTAEFFVQDARSVWDCCAASGGKSILAYDLLPHIDLTVSDNRKSILSDLEERFKKAGIKRFHSFTADLSDSVAPGKIKGAPFDFIIADVPCSGSGTWGRTPEQLPFFDRHSIDSYLLLQRNIVLHALPFLKEKGHILYITCSVFRKENEENVSYFQNELGLSLVRGGYLKGFQMRADTLFASLLTRN